MHPPRTQVAAALLGALFLVSCTATEQSEAAGDVTPGATMEGARQVVPDAGDPQARTASVAPAPAPHVGKGRVFFCRTKAGKTIELHDDGPTMRYVYADSQGEPEMDLVIPRAQATTVQWDGTTSSMAYSVQMPNGTTSYSIFWVGDRDPDAEAPVTGGVSVEVDGRHVADVQCVPGSIEGDLEDIDLRHLPR
ncbi:MAG: hypothetical protein ABW163_03570 [Luteimonas sp.]